MHSPNLTVIHTPMHQQPHFKQLLPGRQCHWQLLLKQALKLMCHILPAQAQGSPHPRPDINVMY